MKINKYIGMAMMATGLLVVVSCSDFDDYNKAGADATPSANQTLWENIQQNPQLSDFASLLKKSGFDNELGQTQYYTVWAPLNGTFDVASFQSLGNDALMRQFVKNHIANYGHQAKGSINERILMLNEKTYNFEGNTSYKFDGVDLAQANLPSNNGVLHTLNGVASFYPNLYEFVTDSLLSAGKEIDSLRHYFLRYENTYLDTKASVVGPIVDGMQTYIDSVMVTDNTLWDMLNIKMNNEDSTYTFLMPNNKAWKHTYDRIKLNYHYISSTVAQAFNGGNIQQQPLTVSVEDPAFWADSLTSLYLTGYLAYSNNNDYNKWLTGTPSSLGSDTLYTTTRQKLSNPKDILAQATSRQMMSNGTAVILDSIAMYPWETYNPELIVSAARSSNLARVLQGSTNSIEVNVNNLDTEKIDVSEMKSNTLRYLFVQNSGGSAKPELDMFLPDVLSTTYDIYCVFVPENVDKQKTEVPTLPNRVIFTLNYCDETGALQNYTFLDEDEARVNAFKEKYKLSDGRVGSANYNTNRAFSNDTSKVDTLYIGEFTFPVCYYGLDEGCCPNIKITSPFSVVTGTVRNDFSRDLRIAAIILKPKELVEFEESNKK